MTDVVDIEDKRKIAHDQGLRGWRNPKRMTPNEKFVLQRVSDGLYLEVQGWGVEWGKEISASCPVFTQKNLGGLRTDDFHRSLIVRFLRLPSLEYLKCKEQQCRLVLKPQPMVGRIQAGGFLVEYDRDKNMIITAPEETREVLRQRLADDEDTFDTDQAMHEILEGLECNSELMWINPCDTGDITDAPILGIMGQECRKKELPQPRFGQMVCGHDPQGDWYQPILARWGWMSYAVKSLQRELLEEGKAVLLSCA